MQQLMKAADVAYASGKMTAVQRAELGKVVGINWPEILKILPLLATFIPALGPAIPIIQAVVAFITSVLNGGLNIVVPMPNGGGGGVIPDPH